MANITLDGVSQIDVFGRTFDWNNNYLDYVNINAFDGQASYDLNAALSGNWQIDYLKLRSDAPLSVNFTNGVGSREIRVLDLGDATGTMNFTNTRVRYLRGEGNVDVTLGSERTSSLELYGGNNSVTLGSGSTGLIDLSDGNDTVNGGTGSINSIFLGNGTNAFNGGNGHVAYLNGGSGNDSVTIRGGADSLSLNQGNDTVVVAAAADGDENFVGAITSYSGNNTVTVNRNAAVRSIGFSGGKDNVTLDGGRVEQLEMGQNDDTVTLRNGGRLDSVQIGDGANIVSVMGDSYIGALGGFGTDRVTVSDTSYIDAATLFGSAGNTITLNGDSRIGSLQLGNGGDVITLNDNARIFLLKMGGGDNRLTTANGYMESIYSYQGSNTLRLGTGGASQIAFSGDGGVHDIISSGYIGSLQVMNNSRTTLVANGGTGFVRLGDGNDVVTMGSSGMGMVRLGGGNDTIFVHETNPGHGTTIQGGDGFDTASFALFGIGVAVSLQVDGGFQDVGDFSGDTSSSVAGYFSFIQVEKLVGTAFGDRLIGGDGNEVLLGGGGNDVLRGGLGSDTIDGGAGNDLIYGEGSGANYLLGGEGNDTVYGGNGADTLGGGNGNDVLYGVAGANEIYGGLGNDVVQGGTGNDKIYGGGSGVNNLLGNDGNDEIWAGTGNDVMAGGAGNDTIFGSNGANTIYLGLGDDLAGGGQGNDVIYAGAGSNRIYGGTGADTVVAGVGRDIISGGPGADVFVFQSAAQAGIGAGRDVIVDFEVGVDKINLSALNMTYIGSAGFSGTAGELRYIPGYVVGDLDGDGVNDFAIQLTGGPALTGSDFIL